MTPNPRQAELLTAVRAQGAVSVEALAEMFGVTRATRIAKLSPGTLVTIEIIDDLPISVASFPSIGDLIP